MKIIVTGATGFIGRPLCKVLVSQGHAVTALTRNVERARSVLGPDVACIAWEAGDSPSPSWEYVLNESDAVVHLAGESLGEKFWTLERKQALQSSRVETTRKIVAAMRASNGPQRALICASGINYYGDRGDELLTEESNPGETFLSNLCVAWEAEARKATEFGVRVVVHRTGIVLEHGGPLEKILFPLPLPISPWYLGLGGPLGTGRQWMPWIHLDDAVGLFAQSVSDSNVVGAVNTVAPALIRNVDFSRALGRAVRRPAILPIPRFVLKSIVGGFADELLTSQRAEPSVAQRIGFRYRYPDIDNALQAILGPTPGK